VAEHLEHEQHEGPRVDRDHVVVGGLVERAEPC
jgi:hypothetical protein